MVDQFAVFRALHAQSCAVASTNCDYDITDFAGYYPWLIAAIALAAYALSGLAARVGAWAVARTERRWLQALLAAIPPVLGIIILRLGYRAWQFMENADQLACSVRIRNLDGSLECLGGNRTVWSAMLNDVDDDFWLIPLVALILWIALAIYRRAPRGLWLFPALCLAAYSSFTSIRGDGWMPRAPLPPDNGLAMVVAPLAAAEGWPMDRVFSTGNIMRRYTDPARVMGLGPWQRIEFGHGWAHGMRDMAGNVNANGFHTHDPSPAAIRAVMGHELAHIQRWHIEILATLSLLLTVGLCLGMYRLVARTRFGRDGWTIIPLYVGALSAVMLPYDMVMDGATLITEYDADRAGLDISREPDGVAENALLHAAGSRLELPFFARWLLTQHPSDGDRIRLAIAWQQANRPDRPVAVPDTRRLLIPVDQPYRAP